MITDETPDIQKKDLSLSIRDRVWAAIHYSKRTNTLIELSLKMYELTEQDYIKFKTSYPS